jgi:hypothetical protein
MNSTFALERFSALELVAGSAALAVVVLIAFTGLRVPQPQASSPAASSSLSNALISSQAFTGASDGQPSEPSESVGTIGKPQSADPRSASAYLISPEPGGAKTPSSPPVDRLLAADAERLDGAGMDDAAGLRQRLVEEALLWEFADQIGGPRSGNAQHDVALSDAAGLHEVPDRPTGGEQFATSSDASATANRTDLSTPNQNAEAPIAPSPRAAQHSLTRDIRVENTFIGGWADGIGECREGQDHGAPLVISAHAAKTAGGECDFRSVLREAASRWRVVARCSSEGESWNAHINLKLAGSNLTWSSERGTDTYVRCFNPQYRHDRLAGKLSPL